MKNSNFGSRWLGVSLLIVLITPLASQFAKAQTQVEEIVVTAEKREAGLQDVPIAVTALQGDFIVPGADAPTLDPERRWAFTAVARPGSDR